MKKLLTLALFSAVFTLAAGELAIKGNFPTPRKAGNPPAGWNRVSGSKGSLELIPMENGNAVILSGDAGMRFGIYSPAVAAKAGDKIKVTATVRGEKIIVGIFQYSSPAGTSVQRQTIASTPEGKEIEAVFTVADTPKGKTDRIRICFQVEKNSGASIFNAKAFLVE